MTDNNEWAQPPSFSDIERAAQRLDGQAVATPLLESAMLNKLVGGRVFLKAENLQRTGSFKFRGAYNRISQIPDADRAAGVIAYSSGNHAQGVAAAAQLLGLPAIIVMPADAPKIKIENTKGYGAQIQFYDRFGASREEIAQCLLKETGGTLIPPFEDAGIIAGQGTCGLEMALQAKALGADLEQVLICCGGGGLSSGSTIAVKNYYPMAQVFTVEPADFDDAARSLSNGRIERVDPKSRSFCDALLSPSLGRITFDLLRQHNVQGLSVTDDQVSNAIRFAFENLKLVVEPGGAVCLAAILANKTAFSGKTTALTLSGGNVDADVFQKAIGAQKIR
ncbi:MAG: threonine/serine dehydratase [Pseudomonadota bacterium]